MKLHVLQVWRIEGVAPERAGKKLVAQVVMIPPPLDRNLKICDEESSSADYGIDDGTPSVVQYMLQNFDANCVVTVRIDLAMKLVIINYVRLMRRLPLDANGTKL